MINIQKTKHILISRADNIGDVILTLPLTAILKSHFPNVKISFLCRDYARAIVDHCQTIDAFISEDALIAMPEKERVDFLKSQSIDVVIHAFPKKTIAHWMKAAKIPCRVGTSHRWFHWLTCNERVNFSRKNSNLHEAQLNLQLLKPFSIHKDFTATELKDFIQLKPSESLPPALHNFLDPNRFNLIVHPFTNGNTREWPISNFIALMNALPKDQFHIVITGSKKESDIIEDKILPHCKNISNLAGKMTLSEFVLFISKSDGLIANSTGPLHIAAALGIHALGLFPRKKGMDVSRWMPLGQKAEVLISNTDCESLGCRNRNDCHCMESITVDQVLKIIEGWK